MKEYFQSNFFILLIALLMGGLCHYFVVNDILSTEKNAHALSIYKEAFDAKNNLLRSDWKLN